MAEKQSVGAAGEELAAAHLREAGYDILAVNYRCPLGEIDIVALHEDTVVFIEVKSRTNLNFGHPQEGLTPSKCRKLTQLAEYYLKEKNLPERKCRFDVVAILLERKNKKLKSIEIITDAF
jgi:putative endonuclease